MSNVSKVSLLAFYISLFLVVLVLLGLKPESVSINLGIIEFNGIKMENINSTLYALIFFSAIGCITSNLKFLREEFDKLTRVNRNLNSYVTKALQGVTGSKGDSVSNSILTGWSSPSVNTGAWTSYNSAKQIIIKVPLLLAFGVRLLAFATALLLSGHKILIPLVVILYMLYKFNNSI